MRNTILFSLLLPISTFAQEDFWAIPGQGRSTALYRTADSTSERLAILTSDDVLLTRCTIKDWCTAQDQRNRQGWVQRTHITALTALDDHSALVWMKKVFDRERRLSIARDTGTAMEVGFMSSQVIDTSRKRAVDTVDRDHPYYHAALSLFEPFYCRTGNESLLRGLMHTASSEPYTNCKEAPRKLMAALRCRPEDFHKVLRLRPIIEQEWVREETLRGIKLNYDDSDPKQKREAEALRMALGKR